VSFVTDRIRFEMQFLSNKLIILINELLSIPSFSDELGLVGGLFVFNCSSYGLSLKVAFNWTNLRRGHLINCVSYCLDPNRRSEPDKRIVLLDGR
jgi:hypothetical protein